MDTNEKIEIINVRVKYLEEKVETLQRQVAQLEKKNVREVAPIESRENAWAEEKPSIVDIVGTPESKPDDENVVEAKTTQDTLKASDYTVGMESRIGKNFMGIVASVLVFCSVVLFGGMIHGILTPMAKTIMILVASAIVAIVGIFKMRADSRYKILFTSLAACGLGALYISCLVSYFILETFSVEAVFVSVVVWMIGLVVLCRRGPVVFSVICYLGIIVATFLAVVQWSSLIIALGLYLVSVGALHYVTHTGIYRRDWLMLVQYPIVCLSLLFCSEMAFKSNNEIAPIWVSDYLLMAVPMVVLAYQILRYKIDEKVLFNLITNELLTLGVIGLGVSLAESISAEISGTFYILSITAFSALLYVKCRKEASMAFFAFFFVGVAHLTMVSVGSFYDDNLRYILPAAIIAFFGCRQNELALRLTSYVLMPLGIEFFSSETGVDDFAIIPFVALMVPWVVRHYNQVDKIGLAILMLCELFNLTFCCSFFDKATGFILFGLLSIFICSRYFRTSLVTGEVEDASDKLGLFVNALTIVYGSCIVGDFHGDMRMSSLIVGTNTIAVCISAVVLLALACVNIKKMCIKSASDVTIAVVYNCLKLTLVMMIILYRITDISYILSIVGILLAIGFIVTGFKMSLKACRLYGLVLSMICVVKLLLFDISFGDGIMRPIGFLVAGLLCFAISWLYSYLEKKKA